MSLVVIEKRRSLDELAREANAAYAGSMDALQNALTRAIACGEILNEAKAHIDGANDWDGWVMANLTFSSKHAGEYMRLATHKDILPAEAFQPLMDGLGRLRQPSVNRALHYIHGLPGVNGHAIAAKPDVVREIRRLYAEGMNPTVIAKLLNVSRASVYRHRTPGATSEYDKKRRAELRRQRGDRRTLKMAAIRDERERLAKGKPGDAADAWGMLVAAAQKIDRAISTATPEARANLKAALADLYRCEDKIVAALRLTP